LRSGRWRGKERLQRTRDDGLTGAAEGFPERSHAAIEGGPVATAMEISRAFVGADVTRLLRVGLRIALRAVGIFGGRQGIRAVRKCGLPFDGIRIEVRGDVRLGRFAADKSIMARFVTSAALESFVLV